MKASLRAKLDGQAKRLEELNRLLSADGVTRDLGEFRKLSREHAELGRVAELYGRYRHAERDAAAARDMALDPAMKSFAEEEAKAAQAAMERLAGELQKALLPRDPNDDRNLFLEIRAGTGGDEAALFAADLLDMVGPAGVLPRGEKGAVMDGTFEWIHRFAQGTSIYGGTTDIQRNLIAEQILGLPRHRGALRA